MKIGIDVWGFINIKCSIGNRNSKYGLWPARLNLSPFSDIKLYYGTARQMNVTISENCKKLIIGGNFNINIDKTCLKQEYR